MPHITTTYFDIISSEKISAAFTERNIFNFQQAIDFIRQLPYGRNANKEDLITLFTDGCGTCSTKHALLKQLANENDFELRLIVGLFKMNGKNTPEVANTLQVNGIEYIPEAHCYLRLNNHIIDCTKINSEAADFLDDLIEEMEIAPNQITDFKVNYHKNYLATWLSQNQQIKFSLNELWSIREQCIKDLGTN